MNPVGIEAMNVFAGTTCLNVGKLAEHRKLDMTRFENLLMKEKTVPMPYEDPVTFGVNAARPLVDALTPAEKDRIEMVITCTESSFDFGKSMSTYFHHHLGLSNGCRLIELKSACYSGVAGIQMAINFILSQASPGAREAPAAHGCRPGRIPTDAHLAGRTSQQDPPRNMRRQGTLLRAQLPVQQSPHDPR